MLCSNDLPKYRLIFFLLVVLCFLVKCGQKERSSNYSDCLVEDKFHFQLRYLESFLSNREKDPQLNRISIIFFLEELTNIESRSATIPAGKVLPTKSEIESWKNWFAKNREYIDITPTCDTIFFIKGDTIRRVKIYFDPELGREDI